MINRSLLQLAARNALRNRTRTLLTAGMVTAGTALLVVSLSLIGGIWLDIIREATNFSGHARVVDPDYSRREQLMPLHENLPEVGPMVDAIAQLDEVSGVYPRISSGVTVTVGEDIGDVFGLVVGAPTELFTERLDLDEKLHEGRWFENERELVIGYRLAQQAEASLGDEIVLLGVTQDGSLSPIAGEIVGIARAGNPMVDQQVFVPLSQMQYLTDIPDGALELVVYTDHYTGSGQLAAALAGVPELDGYAVETWDAREPFASMLPMMIGILGMLVFVLVFMASLGVWNTMMMSVLERTREIGVLRAMGMKRSSTVVLFVLEACAIAVIGGLAGVAIGFVPAWYMSTNGLVISEDITNAVENLPMQTTMYADVNPTFLLAAFVCGLLMAFLGSLLPAIRAALIQPVTAMRSGR